MKLTVIGCAGGFPYNKQATSCYLLTDSQNDFPILLDAGSGSILELEDYLIPTELKAVVVSHDHPDHTADVGALQHVLALRQPMPEHLPIPIYFHPNSNYAKLLEDDKGSMIESYRPEGTLYLGPYQVTFQRTVHPVECYAIRFEEKDTGKVFVYTADSAWTEELIDFSREADLLLADTNFSNELGENEVHMTAREVATLANEAKVKQLIPTHIPPQADRALILKQVSQELKSSISMWESYPGAVFDI